MSFVDTFDTSELIFFVCSDDDFIRINKGITSKALLSPRGVAPQAALFPSDYDDHPRLPLQARRDVVTTFVLHVDAVVPGRLGSRRV